MNVDLRQWDAVIRFGLRRLTVAALALAPWAVGAQTLTFDNASQCGNSSSSFQAGATCSTAGYALTPSPSNAGMVVTSENGQLFAISSVDVSNGGRRAVVDSRDASGVGSITYWTQTLNIVGTHADGSTVSFAGDISDAATFSTLPLDGSFSNLVSLEISSPLALFSQQFFAMTPFGVQLSSEFTQRASGVVFVDNLALTPVAAVPEPSTAALVGIPLLWLALRRRRDAVQRISALP
jgi:hypothetical protein